MANHTAKICWEQSRPNFLKGQYSREHTWSVEYLAQITRYSA